MPPSGLRIDAPVRDRKDPEVAHPVRYRLKLATWIVVRERGQPSPRELSSPQAAVLLARDLVEAFDDDREHFWAILLNTLNRDLMHVHVSTGTPVRLPRAPSGSLRPGAQGGCGVLDPRTQPPVR